MLIYATSSTKLRPFFASFRFNIGMLQPKYTGLKLRYTNCWVDILQSVFDALHGVEGRNTYLVQV